jgi:hypothetical protein
MLSISGRLGCGPLGGHGVASEIPPLGVGRSNLGPVKPGEGHCQPVSFTGAVSSQRVTEEREGGFSTVGNRVSSALA